MNVNSLLATVLSRTQRRIDNLHLMYEYGARCKHQLSVQQLPAYINLATLGIVNFLLVSSMN
jgi:hypothetical protein